MRRMFSIAMILLLSLVAVSCTPFKLKEARSGLEATLADLPDSEGFTRIACLSGEADRRFGDTMCYYAQAIVVVGSHLPEGEAFDLYVQKLIDQGWGVQYKGERSRELVRGEHEKITVRLGAPSPLLNSDEAFQRARSEYPTLVNLAVNYYLPSRKACMGQ